MMIRRAADTNSMDYGARQILSNCLNLRAGEKTVIVTDRATEHLARTLERQAFDLGINQTTFVMEDFGPRPEDGRDPLAFPRQIGSAMHLAQASVFMARMVAGERISFRDPMTDLAEKLRLRHAHMPGFTEEMMVQGMAADYGEIQQRAQRVHALVSRARRITITSPAGTDVRIDLDPKRPWIVCDGVIKPGEVRNLPDGEVFGAPIDGNGSVVIDGCFGDVLSATYGDIGATPLAYRLERGRCVRGSVRCDNADLKRDFERVTFETDENSNRIGELGIGLNTHLTTLIGNILQDEKFPGAHIALGSPYPWMTGATWDSAAHNDGVMRNPTILVGGMTLMANGRFVI